MRNQHRYNFGAVFMLSNYVNTAKRLMGYAEMSVGLQNTWRLNRHIDFVASGGSILYSGVTFKEKS